MPYHLYNAEGARVAKGSLTVFTCDLTQNGFLLMRESLLGPSGEQLAELARDERGAMAWSHTNVYAAGALFASYDPAGLHFLVADWLGSRRAQTDYAGNLEQSCQSLPFGNGASCSPAPSSQLFTTYQRDTESGNDYAQARYYASSQGRFLSPDPSGMEFASPANPQSLNLYGYVSNNPLNSVDPSGLGGCTLEGVDVDCSTVQNNAGVTQCPENDCSLLNQNYSGAYGGSYSLQAGVNGFTWINNANGEELDADGAEEVGFADFNDAAPSNGWSLTQTQQTAIANAANGFLGTPYLRGGCSRKGADCSGSIIAIYGAAGIKLPGRFTSSDFAHSPLFKKVTGDPQIGDVGWYSGHVVLYGGAAVGGNCAGPCDVWSATHTGGNPYERASSSWFGTPTWYRYVGP